MAQKGGTENSLNLIDWQDSFSGWSKILDWALDMAV
jgi:hypothetical protein